MISFFPVTSQLKSKMNSLNDIKPGQRINIIGSVLLSDSYSEFYIIHQHPSEWMDWMDKEVKYVDEDYIIVSYDYAWDYILINYKSIDTGNG